MGNKQGKSKKGDAPAGGAPAGGGGGAGAEDGMGTVQLERRFTHEGDRSVSIDDFDLLKVLGKGSFGKVMLVRKKGNAQLYAMKTLRKAALIKRNQLIHTQTERNVIQHISSPFLTSLEFAFQTVDKLYLVMNYMGGGELFHWLKAHRSFSGPRTRLYAAEIVLGLQTLHAKDIVYRDLKPENILLGWDGHLRLTDFGLSKEAVTGAGAKGGTKTFCGTPEYLAPEILENKGHGKAVDWWSLGTLMYEMLCGLPPFYDQNMQRMYDKILHAELRFREVPSFDSGGATKSILTHLLKRKVEDRLGSGPTDAQEIIDHPYFGSLSMPANPRHNQPSPATIAALDFGAILRKEVEPEFIPPNKGEADTSSFDAEFTSERPVDSVVVTNMSETQVEKSKFQGFTFEGGGGALDDGQ